jgi:cell division protein FtsW
MTEYAATPFSRWWRERLAADPWLLGCALALAAIGLVMVYSASSALALKRHGDSAWFFRGHLLRVMVGLALMAVLASRDYLRLRRWTYPALGLAAVLLIMVLIPGLGHEAGGSARWLKLGVFTLQPSEFAKLALVLYLSYYLSGRQDQIKSFTRGFLPPLAVTGMLILPVILEPDLGISLTLAALTIAMLFVAGVRLTHLGALGLCAVPVLYFLIFQREYWLKRMLTFLSPWEDPANAGFQIIHSFLALGSGGLLGTGLGGSRQKLFYLPEPHTDFILSVLGEELGLWGVFLVLGLFLVIIWRGINASLEAREVFGTYLALGCTMIIGLQAYVNAGVVMGLLPTKGLTLPFISYGGSSLTVNFICVGLILSVAARKGKKA